MLIVEGEIFYSQRGDEFGFEKKTCPQMAPSYNQGSLGF